MAKVHLRVSGVDARSQGQTEFEYQQQTACGYVRDNVTTDENKVTCFFCKKQTENSKNI